ncbi:MAG: acyl carrier protein [Acidobacteria bacterium]|nr:acyl carrier protein [Acidobacteriota bacterium]MCI0621729.1 acyl carrier protein [Acidobacteriota bacterium]MCI0718383.1 acyl carrier protein [Acidobacteriota bacterium]
MDMQKALDWLTDVFTVQGRTLTLNDTRMSVAEWDSLGVLMLLSRLEEDHGIVVSADNMAKVESVKEICDLLQNHSAFQG